MVKFPFEFIILNMFISQKRTHFRENFLGKENFRKNKHFRETKFRKNLLLFASFLLFAKMEKTVLVLTLGLDCPFNLWQNF
jgi:hypothetical protein